MAYSEELIQSLKEKGQLLRRDCIKCIGVGVAGEPRLFGGDAALAANPRGVVLACDFLEGGGKHGGTFVLDVVGHAQCRVGLHPRGGRTRPGDKPRDVADRGAAVA